MKAVTAALIALMLTTGACSGGGGDDAASTGSSTSTPDVGSIEGDGSTTSTSEAPGRLTKADTVHIRGIGDVQAGMTLGQAEKAAGTELVVDGAEADDFCNFVKPVGGPDGVAFMVVEGIVTRVDISSPDITTVSGAHVGSTEQEILDLFGDKIETSPHPYVDGGHYLVFVPVDEPDQEFRVVFETDGAKVTTFRAGRLPEVGWIEGCA